VSHPSVDPILRRFARRTADLKASEIRALFSVASQPEVVSLAGGMPDTGALDMSAVSDTLAEVVARDGAGALQYGGGQGHGPLREQLVEVMAVDGVEAHHDDLVVTTGGQQALDLLAKLFCDPGDVVVAEGPSYVGALSAFASYEADVVHVPMDDRGLDPEALEHALAQLQAAGRSAKLLYTVPNHQNPAGVSLSSDRRERLAELAERWDLLVVEDNPYGLLDFKGETRTALRTLVPERVIYIGTLSKIFSPGIRVGWIAASGSLRDKVVQLKEAADLCQSNLTQHLAERWFATQPWQDQVARFREHYRQRCRVLTDALATELGEVCDWRDPTGGLFVWARLPEGVDTGEMLATAVNHRVAYVPGRAFYADGSGEQELRLNFSYCDEERLRTGVQRLAEVVREELELIEAFGGSGERPSSRQDHG
jgi:DNA-binding transcriptional MocR family regulator